jgi:hypothetical protein
MDGFNVPYSMNEWMNYLMCGWMDGMTYNSGSNVLVGNSNFDL